MTDAPSRIATELSTTTQETMLVLGEVRLVERIISITDMTPVAAEANTAVSHNQFAIPAQEATKQSVERTKRTAHETFRFAIVAVCVLVASAIIAFKPETGWPLAATVGVFGTFVGARSIVDRPKKNASK